MAVLLGKRAKPRHETQYERGYFTIGIANAMRIALFSDLHTEFDKRDPWYPPLLDVNVIVFAGDNVTSPSNLRAYAEATEKRQTFVSRIIYICGNHEFYGSGTRFGPRGYQKYREALTDCPRSILLEMEAVDVGGIRFVGATMWTPVDDTISLDLNDYRYIRIDRPPYRRLLPADVRARYHESVNFFESQSAISDRTVVVTHHPPSAVGLGVHGAEALTANLDELIYRWQPLVWLHGHLHVSHDDAVGATRVMSNPRGYAPHHQNPNFDPAHVIVLDAG